MGVDISQLNLDSPLGQIALLIIVVSTAIVTIKPVIADVIAGIKKGSGGKRKNYAVIANELEATKRELNFAIQIQRHESQWHIVAREIIRLARLDLSVMDESTREKIESLSKKLEEIEDRDIYSEHILIKEEDG